MLSAFESLDCVNFFFYVLKSLRDPTAENTLGTGGTPFFRTEDLGPCVREREVPRVSLIVDGFVPHIMK